MQKEFITYKMAQFTRRLTFEDLDQTTIQNVKRFLLDSIGCAFGGSLTDDVAIMRSFYNDMGGKEDASVINSARKLPVLNAALLNSLMIRALDYNDIYWEEDPSHPSDLIPAVLTPAEVLHKTGKELITAIVLAYEWEQRLCEFAKPGLRERKWHHATLTGFAAPLAAGKILDLSEEQLTHAVGISASHTFTLGVVTAGHLTMMKNTVDPMATQAGLQGALLAQRGYEGPAHVIDGKEGLVDTLGGRFDLDILLDGLGESFRINRCSMKAFPTEALTHTPLSAVLQLMKEKQIDKDSIEEVIIETIARAADILADPTKYDPQTRETADHSLPYCVAAVIVDGAVTPESFTQEKIFDPQIRALLPKIKVVVNEEFEKTFPALKQAAAKIKTKNGKTFRKVLDYPIGDYRTPMDEETLLKKFDSMVLAVTGQRRRDQIVAMVNQLEMVEDTAELMRLLKG
ncbi:MmgE/PrpD family protein [Caldithrix abyssi DSM 13497]|uniref:2-methylcitrate dehydratase n=2 Tax=Caldithrix abyssi TaxID=187145 RepID=H1XXX4_CALAY|nr:2-methylcitrate dehydratase [Caldithrix abyssi DSM 13497]EHO40849.1 MmgE/PrpD family protein [Caldithrix abyssi DSM 13497]